MSHIITFNPPVKGRGGPLLRLPLREPLHELTRELHAKHIDPSLTPYRKGPALSNLIDDITFGVRPKEPVLVVSLGLDLGFRGSPFEYAQTHVHIIDAPMRPDELLTHSPAEGKGSVKIAIMEELSVLAATMLRELGKDCYLSVIRSTNGSNFSGIAIFSGGQLESFIVRGSHPSVSGITIFDDAEALGVLRLLRAHNGLRLLYNEVKDKHALSSTDFDRYRSLIVDFASGAESAHHLVKLVEDVYLAFVSRFPEVAGGKN